MSAELQADLGGANTPTALARSRPGFWIVTTVLGLFLAAASAPTPLYGIYAARWGFSPSTLTVIFAVYALAVLLSLLVAGSLSDSLGRRPVIVAALLLQALSMVAFLVADGVGWLFVARIVQGVATGLVTAAVAAALIDLQPRERPGFGPLLNAVTPTVGLAVGALLAGALVQYAAAPLRLVYAVMLAGFLALAIAMLFVPETVTQRRSVSLRPRIGVEPAARVAFWAALPCLVACWALGGLYLSLGPSLMLDVEHSTNRLLGGSIVFALAASGACASLIARAWAPNRTMLTGCGLLVAGLAIVIGALFSESGWLLIGASVVSGAGFGSGFLGAFRALVARAGAAGRGELIAAIYVVAYLAFSLPAIVAGVLTTHLGLLHTSEGYAFVVGVLAAGSLVLTVLGDRARPSSD